MSRVLKRVLTRKSILGFGYEQYRDLSIQMILDLGKKNILIDAYYQLEKIDFIDDILIELGITNDFRLYKPKKDYDLRKKFYKYIIEQERQIENNDQLALKEKSKIFWQNKKDLQLREKRKYIYQTKGRLQAKNQGKL